MTERHHRAPARLYIEGHHVRKGQVIRVELRDVPPVRFYPSLRRARRLVERFNRMSARTANKTEAQA